MDHIEHPDEAKYLKNNQYIYYIYHLIRHGNEVEIMTKIATNISLTLCFLDHCIVKSIPHSQLI